MNLITGMANTVTKELTIKGEWEKFITIDLEVNGGAEKSVKFSLDSIGLDQFIQNLQMIEEEVFTEVKDREQIMGLLARAYTTTENEKKVLDEVLLEAMVDRLIAGGVSI